MARKIFKYFDRDRDGALSFWEMNNWMHSLDAPTFPNDKDYKDMVRETELSTDKNENVSQAGVVAYYEKYGRLEHDIRALGVGSLQRSLRGRVDVSIDFDIAGIGALENLIESPTLSQIEVKKVLSVLAQY